MKCKICGHTIEVGVFYKAVEDKMINNTMCFNCNFWQERYKQDKFLPPHMVAIIDGTHYTIGDSSSKIRGFCGRKFVIEFNDGTKVITTDLWCQGDIPPTFKDKFPNNAKFSVVNS